MDINYRPTKKRLKEIISRIDELSELIVFDDTSIRSNVKKIKKKINKKGIDSILIESDIIDDE